MEVIKFQDFINENYKKNNYLDEDRKMFIQLFIIISLLVFGVDGILFILNMINEVLMNTGLPLENVGELSQDTFLYFS